MNRGVSVRDSCVQARYEYFFARQAPIFASQKTEILVYLRVRKMRTTLTLCVRDRSTAERPVGMERFCAEVRIARRRKPERPCIL